MDVVTVLGIEEAGGRVMLRLRMANGSVIVLPCTFKPLLDWRRDKADEQIVHLLARRVVRAAIRGGVVVAIRTTPRCDASREGERAMPSRSTTLRVPKSTTAPRRRSQLAAKGPKRAGRTGVCTELLNPSPPADTWMREVIRRAWQGRPRAGRSSSPSSSRAMICPKCHDVVSATGYRQGGKTVYRCPRCGYPVGSS
jgi:hypothetical protein